MRVPFDKYDTAILLEAYLHVEDGTLTRRQAAEKASKELRQRAIDCGMEIDDQFRNYAGIRKQLDVMEFNYTDGKRGYEKRTKIFIEVIDLYRSHREEYEQILREARGMAERKSTEEEPRTASPARPDQQAELPAWFNEDGTVRADQESFRLWLTQEKDYAEEKAEQLAAAVRSCEIMAKKMHMPNSSFYQTSLPRVKDAAGRLQKSTDFQYRDKKEKRLLSRALAAYMEYLSAGPGSLAEAPEKPDAKAEAPAAELAAAPESAADVLILDFAAKTDMSFTEPLSLACFGKTICDFDSWRQLYTLLVDQLLEENLLQKQKVVNKPLPGGTCVYFTNAGRSNNLGYPCKMDRDFYMGTRFSATGWKEFIRKLLDFCGVKYEDVVITYRRTGSTPAKPAAGKTGSTPAKPAAGKTGSTPAKPAAAGKTGSTPAKLTAAGKTVNPTGSVPGKAAFAEWMRRSGMSERTIPSYVSALKQCCRYVQEYNVFSGDLMLTADVQQLEEIRVQLFSIPEFEEYNRRQHNRFRAAFAKYVEFRRSGDLQAYAVEETEAAAGGDASKPGGSQPRWRRKADVSEKKNESTPDQVSSKPGTTDISDQIFAVDFNDIGDMTFTKPVTLLYFGEVKDGFKQWKQLYITFIQCLLADYPDILKNRMNRSIQSERFGIDFADERSSARMFAPVLAAENFFVETNLNAKGIIQRIIDLLNLCHIEYSNVVITYSYKQGKASYKRSKQIGTGKRGGHSRVTHGTESVAFTAWLTNQKLLSAATTRNYASAIYSCEQRAVEYQLASTKLYGVSYQEAKRTADLLKDTPGFQESNEKQHKGLTSAISYLLDFLQDEANVPGPIEESEQISISELTQFDKGLLIAAEKVMVEAFPNGMRKNSNISKKKFRKTYLELNGDELGEGVDIDSLAHAVGFEYSDKIYVMSKEDREQLKKLVEDIFAQGYRVIYYENLYYKNMEFLTNMRIYSAELLKIVLEMVLVGKYFAKTYFSAEEKDTLEQDILASYDDDLILTYDQIKERLPYADYGQIKLACSRSNQLVWAKHEAFAYAERLEISEEDVEQSREIIQNDIAEHGFSVFNRIVIEHSEPQNPEIPEAALKEAIYLRFLTAEYDRNRSILTLPGQSFRGPDLLRDYCRNHTELKLEELMEYEREVLDQDRMSLSVACEEMLRVDRNHFISLESVSFDIDGVDEAINSFVRDTIVPIKSINSFTSFPNVGNLLWNEFLVDSYCRHFSRRFHSMGGPAKNKVVGAVYPADMEFDGYGELLTRVLAESEIELENSQVGQYLADQGYIIRKMDFTEIIVKAQTIRNQEG